VKDTSGAVLPGVTVEAASPALIEKSRTVVSDGTGQYRFVDLKPGTYSVTFTLSGFNAFKRDGVELAGDFTATINADLKVGALEETITVSGESPILDVQSVQRQRVMTAEVVEAVPTGKYFVNLGILIPGVSASCSGACYTGVTQDTGGANGDNSSTLIVHGSRFRDQRISINNMVVRGSTGYLGVTGPNIEAMQETQIDTSGADASIGTGGVRINVVPKDGGNKFAGSFFATGTNEHFQAENLTQELKDRGLKGTTAVKHVYDVAPTFGGPIQKDKFWFFVSVRRENNLNYASNVFMTPIDPRSSVYNPDLNNRATYSNVLPTAGLRLTYQATPRNKFTASYDYRHRCQCPNLPGGTNFGIAPSAAVGASWYPQNIDLVGWSSPVTNKLLLDATFVHLGEAGGNIPVENEAPWGVTGGTLRVMNNAPPASYLGINTLGGPTGFYWEPYPYSDTGFNATYVTGAHAFKACVEYDWGHNDRIGYGNWTGPITSITVTTLANGTISPQSFIVNNDPSYTTSAVAPADGGIYVQDKYTRSRITLSGGLRYDFFKRYQRATTEPLAILRPVEQFFPQVDVVNYKDLSPRMGMAWDVMGNGKTAFKISLNRYVQDLSLLANSGGSPVNNYQTSATRSWTDSNSNFYPDCDFSNPLAQNLTASGGDICGAFTGTSANFGTSVPTATNDYNVNNGYGRRGYNWEFSTSVQQELVPRKVSVDFGYFRRSYGNFTTSANPNVTAANYTPFSVVVPAVDPVTGVADLPLSGQTISGFVSPDAAASAAATNRVSLSSLYGKQTETWQGVDLTTSMRLGGGTLVQGGLSTGKNSTDNCAVVSANPSAAVNGVSVAGTPVAIAGATTTGAGGAPFCHQDQPWLSQVKFLGTYTVPHIDLQVSATYQNIPGPQLTATLLVPAASIVSQIGRAIPGNPANVTVNILAPGSQYGERLNQTDFRVGKIIRFGPGRRATASVDLFNLFNSHAVLTQSSVYPTAANSQPYGQPILIQQARLLKFTLAMNF
jgi:hypothetical protein